MFVVRTVVMSFFAAAALTPIVVGAVGLGAADRVTVAEAVAPAAPATETAVECRKAVRVVYAGSGAPIACAAAPAAAIR
jgi:hypothetical protein